MLTSEIKFGEVRELLPLIAKQEDKVAFKSLFENANGGVSLLAFDAGQKLAEHLAPAEVMVYVLEGEISFKMLENDHVIKRGEFLLMGNGVPHSVVAVKDSKVMLVKVKP